MLYLFQSWSIGETHSSSSLRRDVLQTRRTYGIAASEERQSPARLRIYTKKQDSSSCFPRISENLLFSNSIVPVGASGFEPLTSCMSSKHSNQLSEAPLSLHRSYHFPKKMSKPARHPFCGECRRKAVLSDLVVDWIGPLNSRWIGRFRNVGGPH